MPTAVPKALLNKLRTEAEDLVDEIVNASDPRADITRNQITEAVKLLQEHDRLLGGIPDVVV